MQDEELRNRPADEFFGRTPAIHLCHGVVAFGDITAVQGDFVLLGGREVRRHGGIVFQAEDAFRALLDKRAVALFTFPECVLSAFLFCDVDEQATSHSFSSLGVAEDQRFIAQPDFFTVLPAHAVFHLKGSVHFPGVFQHGDGVVGRVEMIPPEVGIGETFFRAVPENGSDLGADVKKPALRAGLGDVGNSGDLLHQLTVFRFGVAQGGGGAFAVLARANGGYAEGEIVRHLLEQIHLRGFEGILLIGIDGEGAERGSRSAQGQSDHPGVSAREGGLTPGGEPGIGLSINHHGRRVLSNGGTRGALARGLL